MFVGLFEDEGRTNDSQSYVNDNYDDNDDNGGNIN